MSYHSKHVKRTAPASKVPPLAILALCAVWERGVLGVPDVPAEMSNTCQISAGGGGGGGGGGGSAGGASGW